MSFICFHLVIKRLLISGHRDCRHRDYQKQFQSRYRAASHFRNLPSESAQCLIIVFQSRYRAASHFRTDASPVKPLPLSGFNLVIERLLISGFPNDVDMGGCVLPVSISLSSGFSFQVHPCHPGGHPFRRSFNLVIERLLISGYNLNSGALLAQYHLFQSRYRAASHFRSQIGCSFSNRVSGFQSRYRAAYHFRSRALPRRRSC